MDAVEFLRNWRRREPSSNGPQSGVSPKPETAIFPQPPIDSSSKSRTGNDSDGEVKTVGFIISGNKPISTMTITASESESDLPGSHHAGFSFTSVAMPSPSGVGVSHSAPSLSPSSSAPSPTPAGEGASQSTTSAQVPASTSRGSDDKGLIAGISILAILLAISIGAIVFLVLRKRRTSSPEEPLGMDKYVSAPPKYEYGIGRGQSIISLENSIALLENQLHAKDSELRETKAALIGDGRRTSTIKLSDHQINIKFARLVDDIDEWIMMGFEHFNPAESLAADIIAILQRISTSYGTLLRDTKTKHLVLRAMVADVIAQAFVTDQFFGDVTFSELKKTMSVNSSAADLNEWRSITIRLLSRTPSYQLDRAATVEDIASRIDRLVSSLTQHRRSKRRVAHVQRIVEDAATLALELAIQRPLIKVERPASGLGTYNPEKMMEVNAEEAGLDPDKAEKEDSRGKQVRLWMFPAVTRWGDERGVGCEREEVVCRAVVLI